MSVKTLGTRLLHCDWFCPFCHLMIRLSVPQQGQAALVCPLCAETLTPAVHWSWRKLEQATPPASSGWEVIDGFGNVRDQVDGGLGRLPGEGPPEEGADTHAPWCKSVATDEGSGPCDC